MNKIYKLIQSQERKNFPFKPSPEFYNSIGIKRKRWAQILRNEVSPTIIEVENIANYFKVQVSELITNSNGK
jgi:hypothetical protein